MPTMYKFRENCTFFVEYFEFCFPNLVIMVFELSFKEFK